MSDGYYTGIIIEESLDDIEVLRNVKILQTDISVVTEKHATPWLERWTLHTVEIGENDIDDFAEQVRRSLSSKEEWYADLRNNKYHYVIFKNMIFVVDRSKPEQYNEVKVYGISLGIPANQMDIN
jgi:hypothetical protein